MNDLQRHKQTQYLINQKATVASIARYISALNNDLSAALEHQAYVRSNKDENIDASLLGAIDVGVDLLLAQYADVDNKRLDLLAVKNNEMTVEALIAKYNIDLTNYSNSLI